MSRADIHVKGRWPGGFDQIKSTHSGKFTSFFYGNEGRILQEWNEAKNQIRWHSREIQAVDYGDIVAIYSEGTNPQKSEFYSQYAYFPKIQGSALPLLAYNNYYSIPKLRERKEERPFIDDDIESLCLAKDDKQEELLKQFFKLQFPSVEINFSNILEALLPKEYLAKIALDYWMQCKQRLDGQLLQRPILLPLLKVSNGESHINVDSWVLPAFQVMRQILDYLPYYVQKILSLSLGVEYLHLGKVPNSALVFINENSLPEGISAGVLRPDGYESLHRSGLLEGFLGKIERKTIPFFEPLEKICKDSPFERYLADIELYLLFYQVEEIDKLLVGKEAVLALFQLWVELQSLLKGALQKVLEQYPTQRETLEDQALYLHSKIYALLAGLINKKRNGLDVVIEQSLIKDIISHVDIHFLLAQYLYAPEEGMKDLMQVLLLANLDQQLVPFEELVQEVKPYLAQKDFEKAGFEILQRYLQHREDMYITEEDYIVLRQIPQDETLCLRNPNVVHGVEALLKENMDVLIEEKRGKILNNLALDLRLELVNVANMADIVEYLRTGLSANDISFEQASKILSKYSKSSNLPLEDAVSLWVNMLENKQIGPEQGEVLIDVVFEDLLEVIHEHGQGKAFLQGTAQSLLKLFEAFFQYSDFDTLLLYKPLHALYKAGVDFESYPALYEWMSKIDCMLEYTDDMTEEGKSTEKLLVNLEEMRKFLQKRNLELKVLDEEDFILEIQNNFAKSLPELDIEQKNALEQRIDGLGECKLQQLLKQAVAENLQKKLSTFYDKELEKLISDTNLDPSQNTEEILRIAERSIKPEDRDLAHSINLIKRFPAYLTMLEDPKNVAADVLTHFYKGLEADLYRNRLEEYLVKFVDGRRTSLKEGYLPAYIMATGLLKPDSDQYPYKRLFQYIGIHFQTKDKREAEYILASLLYLFSLLQNANYSNLRLFNYLKSEPAFLEFLKMHKKNIKSIFKKARGSNILIDLFLGVKK